MQPHVLRAVACGVSLLVASACTHASGGAKPELRLEPAAFTSGSRPSTDAAGLKRRIDGNDALYNERPTDADADARLPEFFARCIERLTTSAVIRASRHRLTYDIDADVSDCLNREAARAGYLGVALRNSLRSHFELTCTGAGADLSPLDGRTVPASLAIRDVCPVRNGVVTVYESQVQEADFRFWKPGDEEAWPFDDRGVWMHGTMTRSGAPCRVVVTNGTFGSSGCVTFVYDRVPADGEPVTRQEFETRGVTWRSGDLYYRSGTIAFAIDGWRGQATYRSAKQPPAWTATRGPLTTSGTYVLEPRDLELGDDYAAVSD